MRGRIPARGVSSAASDALALSSIAGRMTGDSGATVGAGGKAGAQAERLPSAMQSASNRFMGGFSKSVEGVGREVAPPPDLHKAGRLAYGTN